MLTIAFLFGSALARPQLEQQQQNAVEEEFVDPQPSYAYSFEVADDVEQVYQARTETMEDDVTKWCLDYITYRV